MTSLNKQINKLESEINWSDKNLNIKDLPKNYPKIFVSINGIIIKVLFSDKNLLNLIYEKFKIIDNFNDNQNQDIPTFCFHNKKINMPYTGLIDRDKKIMEVYGNGFGILKSELNGFVSSMSKGVPAHAAGLSTKQIGGNLIIAGRNDGKSTATINLIHLCKNDISKILISDDWVLINENEVSGIDSTISLEPENIKDNAHIDWIKKYDGINRKTSIKLEPNGFEGYKYEKINLDRVILLTQGMTKLITEINNLEEVAQFIIKSAYHFPYNKELEKEHIEYWTKVLQNKQILAFDRFHANSKINGFLKLLEAIRKK